MQLLKCLGFGIKVTVHALHVQDYADSEVFSVRKMLRIQKCFNFEKVTVHFPHVQDNAASEVFQFLNVHVQKYADSEVVFASFKSRILEGFRTIILHGFCSEDTCFSMQNT